MCTFVIILLLPNILQIMQVERRGISVASVDISEYLTRILSEEDKKLFEEAVLAAQAGALRASYIMIWISCAESIKRRFNVAKIRDGQAQIIARDIDRLEMDHKAVDKYLLDKALDYGFINTTEYTQLFAIYKNRCVFGHPYETQPLEEQLKSAAAEAVEFILSKPIKLRHGYMDRIIKNFITVPNYIDDIEEVISAFADEVINKFDNNLYGWFINTFAKELKEIENDANMNSIRFRAYHFIKAFLKKVDLSFMTASEWHEFVMNYEKLSLNVFLCPELFNKIGRNSSDYLVGAVLTYSSREPRVLSLLNSLLDSGLLTDRHIERIKNHFDSLNEIKKAIIIRDSGIDIRIVFDAVIDLLKSHNWYIQNPTVEYIMNRKNYELSQLRKSELEILGRNILQSADGGSEKARFFISDLKSKHENYPNEFIGGILLECFIREDQNIRIKINMLDELQRLFEAMPSEKSNKIINEVIQSVKCGKLDEWYRYIYTPIPDEKLVDCPLFKDIILEFNRHKDIL